MDFIHIHPNHMANVKLIRDLAGSLIMTLDKHYSPYDIVGEFEVALDAYADALDDIKEFNKELMNQDN